MAPGLQEDGEPKPDLGRSSVNIFRSVLGQGVNTQVQNPEKEVRPSHQVLAGWGTSHVPGDGDDSRDVIRVAARAAICGPGGQAALPQPDATSPNQFTLLGSEFLAYQLICCQFI